MPGLVFLGLRQPCVVGGPAAGRLRHRLDSLLPGWPRGIRSAAHGARPDLEVRLAGDRYLVGGRSHPHAEAASPWAAAYEVAQALIARAAGEVPWQLDLHGAAVELAHGGVVLLLGPRGAGKSAITLHLAAAGHRVLGDDRLLLRLPDPGRASGGAPQVVALGLALMVRTRFHRGSERAIRGFIDSRLAACHGEHLLLRLGAGRQASFGEAGSPAGIVLLERRGPATARLCHGSRAAGVQALLRHGRAPLGLRVLLPALAAAVRHMRVDRLGFTDARLAAQAIATAYTHHDEVAP